MSTWEAVKPRLSEVIESALARETQRTANAFVRLMEERAEANVTNPDARAAYLDAAEVARVIGAVMGPK